MEVGEEGLEQKPPSPPHNKKKEKKERKYGYTYISLLSLAGRGKGEKMIQTAPPPRPALPASFFDRKHVLATKFGPTKIDAVHNHQLSIGRFSVFSFSPLFLSFSDTFCTYQLGVKLYVCVVVGGGGGGEGKRGAGDSPFG